MLEREKWNPVSREKKPEFIFAYKRSSFTGGEDQDATPLDTFVLSNDSSFDESMNHRFFHPRWIFSRHLIVKPNSFNACVKLFAPVQMRQFLAVTGNVFITAIPLFHFLYKVTAGRSRSSLMTRVEFWRWPVDSQRSHGLRSLRLFCRCLLLTLESSTFRSWTVEMLMLSFNCFYLLGYITWLSSNIYCFFDGWNSLTFFNGMKYFGAFTFALKNWQRAPISGWN